MIVAPSSSNCAGVRAFTVACVPTGMKTGVVISPCGVENVAVRALPSRAEISKEKSMISDPPKDLQADDQNHQDDDRQRAAHFQIIPKGISARAHHQHVHRMAERG